MLACTNDRNMVRAISKIVGNFELIPTQNLISDTLPPALLLSKKRSHNPGWPQIFFFDKTGFELLILPLIPPQC